MKLKKSYLFISVSTIALVTVLVIQVMWIFESARLKEELFNEKASLVLSKTADVLATDSLTYASLVNGYKNGDSQRLDSVISHYMDFYDLHTEFTFRLKALKPKGSVQDILNYSLPYRGQIMDTVGSEASYKMCLDEFPFSKSTGTTVDAGSHERVEIDLAIPDKQEFLLKEMSVAFITSVLLILVVLFLSWRSILSLIREKEISERTTDFLNNMTHEFRTPLTNIALAGKMIVKDPDVSSKEKLRNYSEIILSENEKLKLQVDQVLSMSALEKGDIPLHKESFDIEQLIEHLIRTFSIRITELNGKIDFISDTENSMVYGDRTHLYNVLSNLLDNAIKYSDGDPEIVVKTGSEEGKLQISVQDKGIGIDKKYIKLLTGKFYRVPTGDVHDVKGFGLGLAYVKHIVELHGGKIQIDSEPGKGTKVSLTLANA